MKKSRNTEEKIACALIEAGIRPMRLMRGRRVLSYQAIVGRSPRVSS